MMPFIILSLLLLISIIILIVTPFFKKQSPPETNRADGHNPASHNTPVTTEKIAKRTRLSALAYLGLMPLALIFIYLKIGTPDTLTPAKNQLPPQPEGPFQNIANLPPAQQQQMIEQMVTRLEQRLLQSPDDVPGWRRLARSQSVMGNYEKSAAAWREVIARADNADTNDWRGLAIALLDAGAGEAMIVNDELENALLKIQATNQNDPVALFFLGIAARDKGDHERAQKLWHQLSSQLPEDAPIMNRVRNLLATVSNEKIR